MNKSPLLTSFLGFILLGPGQVAHAQCMDDRDCKGDRVCADSRCTERPAQPPVITCAKDTDCPGAMICSSKGNCDNPADSSGGATTNCTPIWLTAFNDAQETKDPMLTGPTWSCWHDRMPDGHRIVVRTDKAIPIQRLKAQIIAEGSFSQIDEFPDCRGVYERGNLKAGLYSFDIRKYKTVLGVAHMANYTAMSSTTVTPGALPTRRDWVRLCKEWAGMMEAANSR